MDLMWIEKKAELHVVDLETNFNSAPLIPNQTVEEMIYLECVKKYIGPSSVI